MLITSKDNETIKHIRKLKEKKYRDEYGEYIVEGIKLMIETGIEVEQLILNKGEINGKKIYRNSEKN